MSFRSGIVYFLLVLLGAPVYQEIRYTGNYSTSQAIYDNHHSKLWYHRANTIDIAIEALKEYPGIEIDVVFESDQDIYFVQHDINHPNQGVSLDFFFRGIYNSKDHYYWIDFKNLNETNAAAALHRMEYLIRKYQVDDKLIVESPNAEALGIFARAGVYTSFWAPPATHPEYNEDISNALAVIEHGLKEYGFNALSGDYTNYKFLNKYFPDSNIHIWTNGLKTEKDKKIIKELALKDNIKIILVDYKNNFLDFSDFRE